MKVFRNPVSGYHAKGCVRIAFERLLGYRIEDPEWDAHIAVHNGTMSSYARNTLTKRYGLVYLEVYSYTIDQTLTYTKIKSQEADYWYANTDLVCMSFFTNKKKKESHMICAPLDVCLFIKNTYALILHPKDIRRIEKGTLT